MYVGHVDAKFFGSFFSEDLVVQYTMQYSDCIKTKTAAVESYTLFQETVWDAYYEGQAISLQYAYNVGVEMLVPGQGKYDCFCNIYIITFININIKS